MWHYRGMQPSDSPRDLRIQQRGIEPWSATSRMQAQMLKPLALWPFKHALCFEIHDRAGRTRHLQPGIPTLLFLASPHRTGGLRSASMRWVLSSTINESYYLILFPAREALILDFHPRNSRWSSLNYLGNGARRLEWLDSQQLSISWLRKFNSHKINTQILIKRFFPAVSSYR